MKGAISVVAGMCLMFANGWNIIDTDLNPVDDVTITRNLQDELEVKDGGITNAKLATDVKVGSLASLATTEKGSVVGAINEVNTNTAVDNTTIERSNNVLQIKAGGVRSTELANGAVTGGKIDNNAVTTAKISPLAVTTQTIADNAVSRAKLNENVADRSTIELDSTNGLQIKDGGVGIIKLDASMVRTSVEGFQATPDDNHIVTEKLVKDSLDALTPDSIINVTALPVSDINDHCLYRLIKDSWQSSGTPIDVINAYFITDRAYYVTDSDLVYEDPEQYAPVVISALTNKTGIQNWLDNNTTKWRYTTPDEIDEWQTMVETESRFYGHNLTGSRSVKIYQHDDRGWGELLTPDNFVIGGTPSTEQGSITIDLDNGSNPSPDIIQDGQEYRYSDTKTSSNNYINTQLENIKAMAEGLDIDISELAAFKTSMPHNRFNPNTYFTNDDFDAYLNESIEKVTEAREQIDNILGLLLTIKQGTKSNEELQKEVLEQK